MKIDVIGAGLAGCEAAWAAANAGAEVTLYEMKPHKKSPAHRYDGFAELVCSNSLKAARPESAAGMLKAEMRILGSLTMEEADKRAQDRKKDYEDLLKQEEEKTDKEILGVVRAWVKRAPEKVEWSSVPDRLGMVLGLSGKTMKKADGTLRISGEKENGDHDIDA